MVIGGLQKFSLLDYPGHLSAIVFTQGCNFRCHFCYNPMLVLPSRQDNKKGRSLISEDDFFIFLEQRKDKLDGIVITGGEPTIHKDLPNFLEKIKALGFKTKLDTNGTNPTMLEKLIEKKLIDYIAMDLKGPSLKYKKIVGADVDLAKVKKSIKIILDCNLPYEFRTTIVPGLQAREDIEKMGEMIKGARVWYLQQFKPNTNLVDKDFEKVKPYTDVELDNMRKIAKKYVEKCVVR